MTPAFAGIRAKKDRNGVWRGRWCKCLTYSSETEISEWNSVGQQSINSDDRCWARTVMHQGLIILTLTILLADNSERHSATAVANFLKVSVFWHRYRTFRLSGFGYRK